MIDYKKYGDRLVVGVSGGKDSAATCLHLLEQGLTKDDFDRVFIDTGWEHPKTYQYIRDIQRTIGEVITIRADITVKEEHKQICEEIEAALGFVSPFVRQILNYAMFPTNRHQWCTKKIKIDPLKKYFDTLDFDPINTTGIRRAESKRRANMTIWEHTELFDCWQYRPIIEWSESEVIAVHHRFGLPPNPLYLSGSARVGCWPCVQANKKELSFFSDTSRIRVIRKLEEYLSIYRKKAVTYYKYKNIDTVLAWAKTSYGGKQYFLFDLDEPSCAKWGMCGV